MPETRTRRPRRADAERSRAAILHAAARVLGEQPDAGLDDIAAAADVTRQTVYAHYSSRQNLISAVIDHVTAEVVAALDEAGAEHAESAEAAIVRLLDASRVAVDRYPLILRPPPVDPHESHGLHRPIFDRFAEVIERGRRAHEFTDRLPLDWLVAATIALAHTAAAEVAGGRMTADDAEDALRQSALKMLRDEVSPGARGPTITTAH
ncbi:TetR/AcrR family transcriptional regulator [Qaidamihabitans albus]|uniref:TetR/AcrR family transcriptional regulator n=1 Tax=Qaidamihabitans albus TaxID=2795733 RepID=UPI0018F26EC5|nr:TetR/AcrR family transcriptional regulator [Qaidamihabitans albus]